MNDKLLRAFIEASGFDIHEVEEEVIIKDCAGFLVNQYMEVDYKVTKKVVLPHCDKCNRDTNPMC